MWLISYSVRQFFELQLFAKVLQRGLVRLVCLGTLRYMLRERLTCILVTSLLGISANILAQTNSAQARTQGASNHAVISQDGYLNQSEVFTHGDNNIDDITQSGTSNQALTTHGDAATASSSNRALVVQRSALNNTLANTVELTTAGTQHLTDVAQTGNAHAVTTAQRGLANRAYTRQETSGNTASINQIGIRNTDIIVQIDLTNTGSTSTAGIDNANYIVQQGGPTNTARTEIHGDRNSATLLQVGSQNFAYSNMRNTNPGVPAGQQGGGHSDNNFLSLTQRGYGNSASSFVGGDHNNVMLRQSGSSNLAGISYQANGIQVLGHRNVVTGEQSGSHNQLDIDVIQHDNSVKVFQDANHQRSRVMLDGSANVARVSQH